jgi:hypothetical protein
MVRITTDEMQVAEQEILRYTQKQGWLCPSSEVKDPNDSYKTYSQTLLARKQLDLT